MVSSLKLYIFSGDQKTKQLSNCYGSMMGHCMSSKYKNLGDRIIWLEYSDIPSWSRGKLVSSWHGITNTDRILISFQPLKALDYLTLIEIYFITECTMSSLLCEVIYEKTILLRRSILMQPHQKAKSTHFRKKFNLLTSDATLISFEI